MTKLKKNKTVTNQTVTNSKNKNFTTQTQMLQNSKCQKEEKNENST